MKYSQVTNPQWANAEQTKIDCVVNFDDIGEVPFTADEFGRYDHEREIFNSGKAGEFGPVGEYVAQLETAP